MAVFIYQALVIFREAKCFPLTPQSEMEVEANPDGTRIGEAVMQTELVVSPWILPAPGSPDPPARAERGRLYRLGFVSWCTCEYPC